jgi:nucleotide-binding universal stress UspA family protein
MKKIIYATDYSTNSVAALKYADYLGKMLQSDVIALHVYSPSEEEGGKVESRKHHQEKLLDYCKEHLKEGFSEAEISVAAIKGKNVPHAILDFVRDMDVQMIIMGSCGTSTLKELLVGSTTKELIQISHFPILAVPPDQQPGKITDVLFASTLEEEDISYLQDLTRMLSPINAQIKVVHITQKDGETAQKALDNFKHKVEEKISYKDMEYRSIHSPHVYETLHKTIDETKPDMVVIGEHPEKSEINKVIKRDRVKKMQSCTKVPVLTLPTLI